LEPLTNNAKKEKKSTMLIEEPIKKESKASRMEIFAGFFLDFLSSGIKCLLYF